MVAVADILKSVRPRQAVLLSGYALYLVFIYMAFHSNTVLASMGPLGHTLDVVFLMATMSARVVVYGLLGVCVRFIKMPSTAVVTLFSAAMALIGFLVAGMVFQFAPHIPSDQIMPWLVLGGICLGAGDALITLLWAQFSSTLSLRNVYLYVVLCNALSLVVYFLVTLLPGFLALPIAALLFIASVVFVKQLLEGHAALREWEYSRPVMKGAIRRLWHPVLGTAILCFMSGLMLQISGQQEIDLTSFQQTSLITSAVVVLFLLLPAIFVKKPLNVGRMYAIALPLSAAGFLLLPLIWNAAGGIVNSFAQLGSMVAGIILWCMLADMARDTKLPSTLLFALAFFCTNVAQLAGTLVGFLSAGSLHQGDLVLTTVALVAVYLLFMVTLLLFKDKTLKEFPEADSSVAVVATQRSQREERCDTLAQAHRFTPRETEIFKLLAQGYTMPTISEKLFVSENTVKSHVKSIYQKLAIHVRHELIDLVNSEK
ncbi:MAG: LuxR C-terminal-related transcriptional regulator [Raoultibacter sp.]